jgi:hypothetical protein
VNNPWELLPQSPPYFLPTERKVIEHFNSSAEDVHRIRHELMPEPYLGCPDAPIVLLNLNPGFDEREIHFHNNDLYFMEICRRNLLHNPIEYPFYLLDPAISKSLGHQWWMKKLKLPIGTAGLDRVAQKIFCIEYFPYHSKRFKPLQRILDSQRYSFSLVIKAIQRKALIIIMRSQRLWLEAISELASYPKLYELRSSQNVAISPNNCPDGYPEVRNILLHYE